MLGLFIFIFGHKLLEISAMRLSNIFSSVLLGASVGSFALAQPVEAGLDILARNVALDTRSLDLKVKEEPTKDAKCPDRIKVGNFGPYPAREYTKNQIRAAFLGEAKLAADGKQVGDGKSLSLFCLFDFSSK